MKGKVIPVRGLLKKVKCLIRFSVRQAQALAIRAIYIGTCTYVLLLELFNTGRVDHPFALYVYHV